MMSMQVTWRDFSSEIKVVLLIEKSVQLYAEMTIAWGLKEILANNRQMPETCSSSDEIWLT